MKHLACRDNVSLSTHHCLCSEKLFKIVIKGEVRVSSEPLEKLVKGSLSLIQELLTVLIKVAYYLFPRQWLQKRIHIHYTYMRYSILYMGLVPVCRSLSILYKMHTLQCPVISVYFGHFYGSC